MIVICEECGKKYRIDPSKIKGAAARFKCRVCAHMIMVSKPQGAPAAASAVDLSATETDVESTETGEASAGGEITFRLSFPAVKCSAPPSPGP